MICALCKKVEADKENTHYLTDSVIRTCLNLDGSKKREKGFYLNFSPRGGVEFSFQSGTNVEKIEKVLKRAANEQEIEEAKKNPYSVDCVFCTACEKIFTDIEDDFMKLFVPSFREKNLNGKNSGTLNNVREVRLFAYIQLWRTCICQPQFSIPEREMEILRVAILENRKSSDLPQYPLSITYLETLGGQPAYTSNVVSILKIKNPYVIIMNDMVIQFYENQSSVRQEEIFSLNPVDFQNWINFQEDKFVFRVFSDAQRLAFLKDFISAEAKIRIENLVRRFVVMWKELFGFVPPQFLLMHYTEMLTIDGEHDLLNYSEKTIIHKTALFILAAVQAYRLR